MFLQHDDVDTPPRQQAAQHPSVWPAAGKGALRREIVHVLFFSSRRRHTRYIGDWSSDVCSSDLPCSLRAARSSGSLRISIFSKSAVAISCRNPCSICRAFSLRSEEHTAELQS